MAFVRKKTKVYPWPVEIKTPSQTKIGEFDTTSFTGKFARLSRKEIDTFDSSTEFEVSISFLDNLANLPVKLVVSNSPILV